ncbi:hypothetical protein [Clostridium celatum]|uniref:hypothetical protein n=1 Tax=Clostridium celatum TaxID=36834 RepID=UPI00319E1DC5
MDKILKVSKFNIEDMIKPIVIFYGFLLAYLLFITRWSIGSEEVIMGGIEIFTVLFIVLHGMETFKRKFYFAQSNNISRKSFIKGIILSIFPISMAMAITDLFINRAINAFIKMPSLYEFIIGNFKGKVSSSTWIQDNSVDVMLKNIIFLFLIYCMVYILALVIEIIFYNRNELGKLVAITILIFLPKIVRNIMEHFDVVPYEINNKIKDILNFTDNNIIIELLTYGILFIGLYSIANLLIRKATIK